MTDDNMPEPVAWVRNTTEPQPHCVTSLNYRTAADCDAGVQYEPVYTADQLRAYGDARSAKAQAEVAALRKALKPFADADLTSPVVRDTFGFDVLRARAALQEQKPCLAATPEPPEFGCCLPEGECCMPGLHFPSECHTAADYERQHGVDWSRADDMRAEHDAEMRRDAFGLP